MFENMFACFEEHKNSIEYDRTFDWGGYGLERNDGGHFNKIMSFIDVSPCFKPSIIEYIENWPYKHVNGSISMIEEEKMKHMVLIARLAEVMGFLVSICFNIRTQKKIGETGIISNPFRNYFVRGAMKRGVDPFEHDFDSRQRRRQSKD